MQDRKVVPYRQYLERNHGCWGFEDALCHTDHLSVLCQADLERVNTSVGVSVHPTNT